MNVISWFRTRNSVYNVESESVGAKQISLYGNHIYCAFQPNIDWSDSAAQS